MATSFDLAEAPLFINAVASYSAFHERKAFSDPSAIGPGVFTQNDGIVAFASGRAFSVSAGDLFVEGGNNLGPQGMYRCTIQTGAPQLTFDAGDATPRIDQVVVRVYDTDMDSSTLRKGTVEIIKGVASAGADLDNRTGAIDLTGVSGSRSMVRLADALIGAGATTISAASIRDRRPYSIQNAIPNLGAIAAARRVVLEPHPGHSIGRLAATGARYTGRAALALCSLPDPISATKIGWAYSQDPTNPMGTGTTRNYMLAVLDASGRLMARTAQTPFAGAANTAQYVTPAWSTGGAVYFPAGAYYVWFGFPGTLGASETITYQSMVGDSFNFDGANPSSPNLFFGTKSGVTPGPNFPTTNVIDLANYNDRGLVRGETLPVPICTLVA